VTGLHFFWCEVNKKRKISFSKMMNSAMMLLFSSNTIYIILTCFILTLILIANELNIKLIKEKLSGKSNVPKYSVIIDENNNNSDKNSDVKLKEAPGPKPRFIVGNLEELSGYEIPYEAFSVLSKKYGKIIKLQLGSLPAIVINGLENIKEVLVTKGQHFDSRPNFRRYHQLFSGNKENCKWFFAMHLNGYLLDRVLM
jgi:cytochrome P450 family 307 subfamily A